MKHQLRTKFFYVLVCASLIATLAFGAQTTMPAMAAPSAVGAGISAVALTSSDADNSTTYGDAVTFSAQTSPFGTTGTVTFLDGVTIIGTSTLNGSGQAGLIVNNLGAGSSPHIITARYDGDVNYAVSTSSAISHVILKKALTVTGVTPNNKVYDSSTAATFGGTLTLAGFVLGQTQPANVNVVASGIFSDKNVGTNKVVTAALTLSAGGGTDQSNNYSLTQPAGPFTANITPAALTLSGVIANNKVYDRTVAATFNIVGASLVGVQGTDDVFFNSAGVAGTFATKDVGAGQVVSLTLPGFGLIGADASNYSLTQPAGFTANITAKPLAISGLAPITKVYDRTTAVPGGVSVTSAILTAGGVIAPDVVTLTKPASPAVGTYDFSGVAAATKVNVTGFGLSGADAANYTVASGADIPATITPKAVTLATATGGITAVNKPYDGTTDATLNYSGAMSLVGTIAPDTALPINGSPLPVATFADANVGTGKQVTATGVVSGNANYVLTVQPSGAALKADITTAAPLTLSLATTSVTYNGSPWIADLVAKNSGGFEVPGIFTGVTYNGSATAPTDAGSYVIGAAFTPTDTANYANVAYTTPIGTLVIGKANSSPLSVSNSPVEWSGAPQAAVLSAQTAGTFSSVTYNGSATVPTDVGTYLVRAAFTPADAANWSTVAYGSIGNFVISKATPVLSVTSSPVIYDGSLQSPTVGSVPAGVVSNILVGGAAGKTNVGTYAVTADFVPTDAVHYSSLTNAAVTGSFIINKATPTATLAVSNSPVAYTGLPQSATVAVSTSSVPGAAANIVTGGAASQTAAGTYAVTADFIPTDTANYNSLAGLSAGNFVINPAIVGTNRTKNGGFEFYSGLSNIPNAWVAMNFGAGDGKSAIKKSGLASVKMIGAPAKAKTLTQVLALSGVGGDALTFSFWVKGTSVPVAGLCRGQVLLYNGSSLVSVQTINCTSSTYFLAKTVSFTAPGAYTKAIVKFTYTKSSGSVWFDNVFLVK